MTKPELNKIRKILEKAQGVISFTITNALADIDSVGFQNVEFEPKKELEVPF